MITRTILIPLIFLISFQYLKCVTDEWSEILGTKDEERENGRV